MVLRARTNWCVVLFAVILVLPGCNAINPLCGNSMYKAAMRVEGDRAESALDRKALPSAEEMDQILRYEDRMQRQLDWAMQRLRESQERRFVGSPSELALIPNSSKG